MAYTTINKSSEYFNTKLYTGNGSYGHGITGVGFQPDLVWIKNRVDNADHRIFDAVRGTDKSLSSNNTNATVTSANFLHSFDSDGFTVDDDGAINTNNNAICSWNWKANGAGSSNTDGSITSTVSANTTAGFSIVKFTGNGSSNQSIGHGLNAIPKVIILKQTSGTEHWAVYHVGTNANQQLYLNLTNAQETSQFGSSAHTSSVFYVGSNVMVNGSGSTYIAYCFADVTGYSKFGSYTGNGNADGTFVYTGFKPAFVMVKKFTEAGNSWVMLDTARSDVPNANVNDQRLYADHTSSEASSSTRAMDLVSNGFKIRGDGGDVNNNSQQYIYMCFASEPLVGDNPATAR
nr:hypothetical protein [uncultured Mediterranean phage uvMED]BAR27286.1 hypothetical protein [uncultured Mediterranean phage uvMED]